MKYYNSLHKATSLVPLRKSMRSRNSHKTRFSMQVQRCAALNLPHIWRGRFRTCKILLVKP